MSDPTITEALSDVMADVQAVRKLDRNEQQGFSFRGIDAVVNAVGPALRAHHVVVLPELVDLTHGTVDVGTGDRRRPIGHVVVRVRYRFVGPAGDELVALVPGEAMDSGDKAIAKAMSVAYRVALLQALCIPTDEPDPDGQVYERAPAEPEQQRAALAPADMTGMVLAEAERAGFNRDDALADVMTRHDGRTLDQLDRDELREEWRHWHAQPQQPASDQAPKREEPRPASSRQLTKLATQLSALRVTDRGARLEALSRLTGRRLPTMKQLTAEEAGDLIALLDRVIADDKPADALAALLDSAGPVDDTGEQA